MVEAFTIGIVPGVTPDKWLRVWRERMPGVPLRVVAVDDADAVAMLQNAADMAFARLPVPDDDRADDRADDRLHVIPLWDETPVVVVAKDHPAKLFDRVTLADLEGEELRPGWDESTLDLVAAGHGVARMPQSVFRATGRRDVVAREISDAEPTRIGLIWRESAAGALVDEFIGIVRGRTANSSRGGAAEPPAPKHTAAPKAAQSGRRAASGRPRGSGRRRG